MNKKEGSPLPQSTKALQAIGTSRVLLPVLIGVGVVIYFLWQRFDAQEFAQIEWTSYAFWWIGISFILLVIRHLAYAMRLRILSEGAFSWSKCIELIFIWEFSSAVSPTSVGGSAVALFVLAQEKLAAARVAAIVLYTAVLDTIFFVVFLPVLLFIFGANIIRPNLYSFSDLDGWGYTFIGAYIFMFLYGAVFFYGLFINPHPIKRFFEWATRFRFLRRFHTSAVRLGDDFVVASTEIAKKGWKFRLGAFGATATAWACRFLLLSCLIIAIVPSTPTDFWTQGALYGRLKTMFVVMAFSPTPGGAGFAEVLFNGFLADYIQNETASYIIAIIWRLFTYYLYLLIGVIIIPNWIRKRINEKR